MNIERKLKQYISVRTLILVFVLIILFVFYFNFQVRSGKLFNFKKNNNKPLVVNDISLLTTTDSPLAISDLGNLTSTLEIKELTNIQLQVEDLVIITNFNIVPTVLTINKNSKVTWINNSDKPVWLTSVKSSKSSVLECNPKVFDSCKEIKPKEKWSFVFSEPGEWEYYDRLNHFLRGKIIVK